MIGIRGMAVVLGALVVIAGSSGCTASDGPGSPDVPRDAADDAFPGPGATCDEMVSFVLAYARDHSTCDEGGCVCRAVYRGSDGTCEGVCLITDWGLGSRRVPALCTWAYTDDFQALLERIDTECCVSLTTRGDGWSCDCIIDLPWVRTNTSCVSGRCQGELEYSPDSCHPFPDGGADDDA